MTVIMYHGGDLVPALFIVAVFFAGLGCVKRTLLGHWPKPLYRRSVPKTGEDWIHLVLVPIKTYAVAGYPFLIINLGLVSKFSHLNDESLLAVNFVLSGYLITTVLLVTGALIQAVISRVHHSMETAGFGLLGIAFWHLTGEMVFVGR